VDLDSLELVRARSVGVELVGLWAVAELRLAEQIQAQGMSLRQVWAAVGTIVARMAAADAEGGILSWWGERSAIGELLGVDFTAFSPALLSRAADSLLKHRMSLEEQVFARVSSLFGLSAGESIYELSRACFNGAVGSHATARFGNAREVQNDGLSAVSGPLTLGLVLDHSGFIRRSAGFVDHTAAGPDLKAMLDELGAPPGALVRIGQGVASAASLAWLRANGFRTLVVTGDHVCTIAQDLPLESGPGRAEIGGDGGAQLFISVLSHQCVQVLRRSLLAQGIDSGWPALCQTLSGHCRVTTSLRLGDGRTLHVRQATRAEPEQLAIYQALGIDPAAGGVQKTVI
jgi:hypothetical protein